MLGQQRSITANARKPKVTMLSSASGILRLQGLWINIPKNQLFCLLGPNGAGKSTTINCVIGITPVTGGDALVFGHSIRSSTGMSNIRNVIGVCPQFDILWKTLSGEEHLQLFACIKGVPSASIDSKLLAEVKLIHSAKTRAGSYSGGMKRCISVSIALIGEPKLILLDEPMQLSTAVKEFFKSHLDILPKEESKSFLTYIIPHENEKLLKNFFAELQERSNEYGIADIQLSLTTLEEVFLNIARKAELDSAAAVRKYVTLTMNSGLSYQVDVGARFVGLPGTESEEHPRGKMVEIYWQQDDEGALCISGYSREVPIPEYVQLLAASTAAKRTNRNDRHGIVIHPSEIEESDFL